MPPAARITLSCGMLGLALAVANQLLAGEAPPALVRAGTLAALMAVGLMLVAVLWTRAVPVAAERVALEGREGLEMAGDLPADLAGELAWGSQMLLTATAAAVVLLWWDDGALLRRGLLAGGAGFRPGPICERCRSSGRTVSLVNLALYPGRAEFDALLPDVPAVLVEPIGERGWLVVGGWSPRCFSRSDEVWIRGWARKLRTPLEAAPTGDPRPRPPAPATPGPPPSSEP